MSLANPLFATGREVSPPAPRRFYARYAQGERLADPEARVALFFEAVGADWFDDAREFNPAHRAEFFAGAPLALLELHLEEKRLPEILPPATLTDSRWLELVTDAPGEGLPLSVCANLFQEGQARSLHPPKPVDDERAARLDRAVSLGDVPDASPREIARTLPAFLHQPPTHAVVFDVGQGSAMAFLDQGQVPCLYFDLGGGVGRHAPTFPAALQKFCFTADPPILLSHWDHDHWSSPYRDPRALQRPWIAPRQSLGPIHAAFASEILRSGRLLLLPDGLMGLTLGDLTLERGTGRGRNDTGLALTWRRPRQPDEMLFPADARYHHLPSVAGKRFHSIVAPHHGARPHSIIPKPQLRSASRLVYSYGANNQYDHPTEETRQDHHAAGWTDRHVDLHGPWLVRDTVDRSANGLGHVLLEWERGSVMPGSPCQSQSCQLAPTQ